MVDDTQCPGNDWYKYHNIIDVKHGPTQRCLFYSNKWLNVCLSCGKVEIDGVWKTLREMD